MFCIEKNIKLVGSFTSLSVGNMVDDLMPAFNFKSARAFDARQSVKGGHRFIYLEFQYTK